MRTLTLQLVGTTPILLHHISKHQLREQVSSRSGGMSIEDEALNVMMKDEKNNPAVPVSWLWDAIRVGCARITVENKQVSFFKLQSLIQLPEGLIALKDTDNRAPKMEVYSSLQHATPESRKSIVVVAPMFKDWMLALPVAVLIENQLTSEEVLNQIFTQAGRVGIGLFHPPKKHFGQFRISM